MENYKIYIGGALTHATKNLKNILEEAGNICQKYGIKTYIPHLGGTDPIKNPKITAYDVWLKNHNIIATADIILAYVGVPSLGTGAELEIARVNNTKIILWHFTEEKVSRMSLGNPGVMAILEIKNIAELKNKLFFEFNKFYEN